jgi:hypothetical protein
VAGGHNSDNSSDWTLQARIRLARRRAEKPATKAGQIRALWPDIEAALAGGQSMKTVCAWLAEEAGITLGLTSLTSYVSRIRRRGGKRRYEPVRPPIGSDPMARDTAPTNAPPRIAASPNEIASISGSESVAKFDPLANYRARQGKSPGFNYRPATAEDEKDLI